MRRSMLAVLAGYLIFGFSAALLFGLSGHDPHSRSDVSFIVGSILYGVFFAGLGGWVAGVLNGRREFLHGMLVALVIAIPGVLSLVLYIGKGPVWSEVSTLLLMVPAAMVGGYLRERIQKRGLVKEALK